MTKTLLIFVLCLFFITLSSCKKNGDSEGMTENAMNKVEHSKNNFTTYCNPIDIDYSYMSHYRAENNVSYRSGADPAIVNFKGRFYMFVTRSHGYWASDNMSNWKFIKPQS